MQTSNDESAAKPLEIPDYNASLAYEAFYINTFSTAYNLEYTICLRSL